MAWSRHSCWWRAPGGGLIGVATGFLAAAATRQARSYNVELTISLALVLVTYRVAQTLGVSGPIAVVAAGLLIGNQKRRPSAAAAEGADITAFWGLVDELLNAMLFLLIGFQMLVVEVEPGADRRRRRLDPAGADRARRQHQHPDAGAEHPHA